MSKTDKVHNSYIITIYEIHDEVSNIDKVRISFIKWLIMKIFDSIDLGGGEGMLQCIE